MSVFEKFRRARIYTAVQHPYKHTFNDVGYNNSAMGGQVTTVSGALDYLFAVLYPQSKTAVANPAALPLVANTLNDMRVVVDDGDGKSASYRWEQREGEVSPSWHKIYDLDWGFDSILQQMFLKTQDIYASKRGFNDIDAAGNAVVGVLAGQSIYGGATANTNLTLLANSGDGTGAQTGFVQFGDQVRPTTNNTVDLGTTALRFKKVWANEYQAGTLNAQAGAITDTSGTINFSATNLTTTGNVTANNLIGSGVTVGTLSIAAGSITDSSTNLSFGSTNLLTTGTIGSGVLTVTSGAHTMILHPNTGGKASIAITRTNLTFGAANLETTGSINAGSVNFTQLDVDNIRLDGNTITTTNLDGNLIISANGVGVVDVQSPLTTVGQTVTGILSVTGQLNADNLRLDGNVLSSTNANGTIDLTPNGVGSIRINASLKPITDNAVDVGDGTHRVKDVYLSGALKNGTDVIDNVSIFSLKNNIFRDALQTLPAQAGDALFYDAVSGTWLASAPDSEIEHGTLSGLGDDDHPQYALLAGRPGGQTLTGGTAASENLTFESTAHATKGKILTKDTIAAFTDASFSVSWQGSDVGGASNRYRHVYTAGEFFGLRLQNVSANPSSNAQNPGRLVWNTVDGRIYVDDGSAFKAVNVNSSVTDTSWDGSTTTQTFTVSGLDARSALWQIKDNANNFLIIYPDIEALSATQVRVTATPALPAGTYRLIGKE